MTVRTMADIQRTATGATTDPQLMTPEVMEAVKQYSRAERGSALVVIALTWGVVVGTAVAAEAIGTWWAWCIALPVIASRQHGLSVLMHEFVHGHFQPFRSATANERFSDYTLAFPMFVTTRGFRISHLAHHRYLNSAEDPDLAPRFQTPDWVFPKKASAVAWLFAKDLLGNGIIEILKKIRRFSKQGTRLSAKATGRRVGIEMLVYLVCTCLTLTLLQGWWLFLKYWLAPAFLILPAMLRNRSISEHYGLTWTNDFESSRNIMASPIERFLFSPWAINVHAVHHMFPSVSCLKLDRLHSQLRTLPYYAKNSHDCDGYFFGKKPYIRELQNNLGRNRPALSL